MHGHYDTWSNHQPHDVRDHFSIDYPQMHQITEPNGMNNNHQQPHQIHNGQYLAAPQSFEPQIQEYYQSMPQPPNDQMLPSNTLQQPMKNILQMEDSNLMFQNQPRAPQPPPDESNSNSGFLQIPNILSSVSNFISNNPFGSPAENPQVSQNQDTYLNQPQKTQTYLLPQNQLQQSNKPQATTTNDLQSNPLSQNQPTYPIPSLPPQPQTISSFQNVQEYQNQLPPVTEQSVPKLSSSVSQTGINPTEFPLNPLSQPQLQSSKSNSPSAQLNEPQKLNQLSSFNKESSPISPSKPPPNKQTEESSTTQSQNPIPPLPQQLQLQSAQSNSETQGTQKEQNQLLPTAKIQSPITNQQPTTEQTPSKISSILPQLLETNPALLKNQLNTPSQLSTPPSETQLTQISSLSQQVPSNPQSESSSQNVQKYSPHTTYTPSVNDKPNLSQSGNITPDTNDQQHLQVPNSASNLPNLTPGNNIPHSPFKVSQHQGTIINNSPPNPLNNLNSLNDVSVPGSPQPDLINGSNSNVGLKSPSIGPEVSSVIGNSNSETTLKINTPPNPVEPETKENKGAFASMENKEFDAPENFNGLAMYESSYSVNTEDTKNAKENTNKLRVHADPSDIHILNLPPIKPSSATSAPNNFDSPNSPAALSDSWSYGMRPNHVQMPTAADTQSNTNEYLQQLVQSNNGRDPSVLAANVNDQSTDSSGYAYKKVDLNNPPPRSASWSLKNHDDPVSGGPTDALYKNRDNYPQQGVSPFNNGINPIVLPANVNDQSTDSSGYAYKKVDLNNPPSCSASWSLKNHDDPVSGGPTDALYKNRDNYPQQGVLPFDNGINPIVLPADIDDRQSTDSSGYAYKKVDLNNPPPRSASWSLKNFDDPVSGGPTGALNKNYNRYPTGSAPPFNGGGRNPIVLPADIDDRQSTDSDGYAYKKVDLNNPPPRSASWSLKNFDDPVSGGPTGALNKNYNRYPTESAPPFNGGGRNPIALQGTTNLPATDGGGYAYRPVNLNNAPTYSTSWSLPSNRDSGRPQNQNANGGYPNSASAAAGGYYPQTTMNGLGQTPQPPPPRTFNQNYDVQAISSRRPVPIPPNDDAFAQNTMTAISNALRTPMYGTRAVFDVTRSNFPNMQESQQINLTYVVVQAIALGLQRVLDDFVNRVFQRRVKRDFNPASTISTTPADVLRNLAGRTTLLQPGAPTRENDYRPAAAATGTSANIPHGARTPALNRYSANAFRRPTNGFGDVGTPRTDTDFRGAVADVFTEDIENAVRSNLPEPYRRDSPRVTRYVRQLTLVAAAAFQKQINEVLQENAASIS